MLEITEVEGEKLKAEEKRLMRVPKAAARGLRFVHRGTSKDKNSITLRAIFMDAKHECLVATDGFKLVATNDREAMLALAASGCGPLARLDKASNVGGGVVKAEAVEGNFPDFETAIAGEKLGAETMTLLVDPGRLRDLLEGMAADTAIRLTVGNNGERTFVEVAGYGVNDGYYGFLMGRQGDDNRESWTPWGKKPVEVTSEDND